MFVRIPATFCLISRSYPIISPHIVAIRTLGSKNPKVDASEFLRQQGVSGIKYLDNFSRRQPEWIIQSPKGGQNIFNSEAGALEFLQRNPEGKMIPPAQTYNYVMFPGEEKNIKILERQDR